MSNDKIQAMIDVLDLKPHPEGGFFSESYRSEEFIHRANGDKRTAGTAIYFLLPKCTCTRWHRVHSDELWHFYSGDSLVLEMLNEKGVFQRKQLGNNASVEFSFQASVPAGCWQRSYSTGYYSLAGCTVAPGFEFDDFDMIEAEKLAERYPDAARVITSNPF